MKRLLVSMLLILLSLTVFGCSNQDSSPTNASVQKPQVYATFYPMYFLTEKIGGDKIQVNTLIPPGVEPHDWEPSPKTLANLSEASLLVANGLDMEPWLEELAQVAPEAKVLKISEGLNSSDTTDPHLWLDPLMAQKMARRVADSLVQLDPANKDYYEDNLIKLHEDLNKLHQEWSNGLKNLTSRDLVVSHEAFGYLAKRYNLKQVSLRGLDPDAEPTPARMAELVDYCKSKKIKVVFYEELINPKISEILANEVGAQTLGLNPLESLTQEELAAKKDYFSVMKENLAHIKQGLE